MQPTGPDPTTVATVWHSMQTACKEMRHIIERTAQNYLIGQLHDVSVGIWGANGETLAVPVGLPVQFLGTGFAVRSIVEKFQGTLAPGDIILTNDPYHGGHNCHLPDWGFFRPIFHEGEVLFFTLARAHQQDTGGAYPGGYFPNGYDIHAEGLVIPPIKVVEAGRERADLLELIWNNVRWPEGVRIDNYAMIAATKVCEQRLSALLDKYGRDTVVACCGQMMERTERAVAAWGKHRGDYVSSVDLRTGERYVRTSFDYDGSTGAVRGYDGYQGVSSLTALGAVTRGTVEEVEVRVPWRALRHEFLAGFSGAGRRGAPCAPSRGACQDSWRALSRAIGERPMADCDWQSGSHGWRTLWRFLRGQGRRGQGP